MPTGHYKRKPMSDETKRKISVAMKGKKPHPNTIKARIASPKALKASQKNAKKAHEANRGKIIPLERRERISESNKHFWNKPENRRMLSLRQRGDKSHNWKGGKTPKRRRLRQGIEFKLWREAVFKRDNWTCQECGVRGGTTQLHPHHIKSFAEYPELRFAIDNGLTLCAVCHQIEHGQIKLSEVRNHG